MFSVVLYGPTAVIMVAPNSWFCWWHFGMNFGKGDLLKVYDVYLFLVFAILTIHLNLGLIDILFLLASTLLIQFFTIHQICIIFIYYGILKITLDSCR